MGERFSLRIYRELVIVSDSEESAVTRVKSTSKSRSFAKLRMTSSFPLEERRLGWGWKRCRITNRKAHVDGDTLGLSAPAYSAVILSDSEGSAFRL